jgi:flagellar hook-associated protein 2
VTTLRGLSDWINSQAGLKDAVQATLIKQNDNSWVLSIQGRNTGAAQAITVSAPAQKTVTAVQAAQDARFTMNGIEFSRSTNVVSDAISGLTLNLLSSAGTPTVIEVAKDTSPVKTLIQKMVSSYNDLLAEYQSDTQSSTDASQRGVLNSDLTLSTIMRQITESFSLEIKRLDGSSIGRHHDLSVLGLEFDTTGKLIFKESLFNASSQLPGLLEQGIKIGYKSATQDLSQTLANVLSDSGSLSDRIAEEKHTQTDLNKRKTQMQEKLATLQDRYTAQYAALDALLFQLNNTNNALKSALDGLTNSQKNN